MPLIYTSGTRQTPADELGRLIRARDAFTNRTGALHGERRTPGGVFSHNLGYAGPGTAEELRTADYIAWSFRTPILWRHHRHGTFHMPRLYISTIRDNRSLVGHMQLIRAALEATIAGVYHPPWHGRCTGDENHDDRECGYRWPFGDSDSWQLTCTLPRVHNRAWWHEAWQHSGTQPMGAISPSLHQRWTRPGAE